MRQTNNLLKCFCLISRKIIWNRKNPLLKRMCCFKKEGEQIVIIKILWNKNQ